MSRLPKNLGRLDKKNGQPLYQQLERLLKGAIERNVIGPNDALLPERDLASELDVSRITVRKAIDGLVAEGLLVRRQGSGTFVKARVEKNFSQLSSFSDDMRARGLHPRSVWLKRSQGTVTPEESLTMQLSPGTPVYRLHRIRFADDAPMALEYATVLASSCPPSRAWTARSTRRSKKRQPSGKSAAAAARRAADGRAGEVARRECPRRGPARGARGLPCGRPRRRILPVVLSRRHLRLRRRAQHTNVTAMFREAAESAAAVRRQLRANAEPMRQLGAVLRRVAPRAVVTIARGSSDHAATYALPAGDALRRADGIGGAVGQFGLCGTAGPSRRPLSCDLAVGRSPDLLAAADAAVPPGDSWSRS
jgi:DNA-binding transcriptional regulator YhcF (GntR family)